MPARVFTINIHTPEKIEAQIVTLESCVNLRLEFGGFDVSVLVRYGSPLFARVDRIAAAIAAVNAEFDERAELAEHGIVHLAAE